MTLTGVGDGGGNDAAVVFWLKAHDETQAEYMVGLSAADALAVIATMASIIARRA